MDAALAAVFFDTKPEKKEREPNADFHHFCSEVHGMRATISRKAEQKALPVSDGLAMCCES